jgi:hypothetical protein
MELLTIQHDNILNTVDSNHMTATTPTPRPRNLEEVMTTFGDVLDGTLGLMRRDVHLDINENAKPTVMHATMTSTSSNQTKIETRAGATNSKACNYRSPGTD